MNRRKFVIGLGAASASGSALIGSGAFTSVSAERDIAVDVTGDDDAFLRLGACTDSDGEELPNGAYVDQEDGLFSISLSDDNGNDPPEGSGVNPEALSKFHNVFEICNQGTQEVCVNFAVDVPPIPEGADVPSRYDFDVGDPAVVFYEEDDEDAVISVGESDPDLGKPLEVGECLCVGLNVRAFGFSSGEDIFADASLEIIADAEAECSNGIQPPEPECAVLEGEYDCTSYSLGDFDEYTAGDTRFEFSNVGDGPAVVNYAIINDPDQFDGDVGELDPGESATTFIGTSNPHEGVVFWNSGGEDCASTWETLKSNEDVSADLIDFAEDEAGIDDSDYAVTLEIPEDVADTEEEEFDGELNNIPEEEFPEALEDYDVEPCDPPE